MGTKYKLSNDVTIEVSDTPLGSGGEADIYEIISPANYSKQILKIYRKEKRSGEKENKLKYLTTNKPQLISDGEHHAVVWPTHLAYLSETFIGYTMPKATGVSLELLCLPKLPKGISKEFEKFSFNTPGAINTRKKLCFNIGVAISRIHAFGSYVLVDMKPSNIMVNANGLISIIDIDSIEIINGDKLIYPAHVITPEYTPPEHNRTIKNIETSVIKETWDRFSLAVIFYRILFGIHPFTGTLKHPYQALTNVTDIMEKGFLPVGSSKDKFSVMPPPHQAFFKIDQGIRQMFVSALELGYNNTLLRPSADDWCRTLSPDLGVILNRKLPSNAAKYFTPTYSSPIILIAITEEKIQAPVLIVYKGRKGLIKWFLRLFYQSKEEKQLQLVKETQQKVKIVHENLLLMPTAFKNRKQKFETIQGETIELEKRRIEKLLTDYKIKSIIVDNKAKELFHQESDKYNSNQRKFLTETNPLEFKIKEGYTLTVGNLIAKGEKRKNDLQSDLDGLINRESNELTLLDQKMKRELDKIKTEIKLYEQQLSDKIDNENKERLVSINKRKDALKIREDQLLRAALEKYQAQFSDNSLVRYKIADDRYSIFTDSYADPNRIISNLIFYGIVTAADIKGVDQTGKILKANGEWVKVPDIAASRAQRLDDWRKRIQRQYSTPAPQQLPYTEEMSAKAPLINETNKIAEDEKLLHKEINEKKSNIPAQLRDTYQKYKREEENLVLEIQTKKSNISSMMKLEKDRLRTEIKNFDQTFSKEKDALQIQFNKHVESYRTQLEQLMKSKMDDNEHVKTEFNLLHESLLKEMRSLEHSFRIEIKNINEVTLYELEKNNRNYQDFLNEFSTSLKNKLDIYNESRNDLLEEEKKYNILQAH